MNERTRQQRQAADFCDSLAGTFAFLAEVNNELGKPRETAKYFYKAIRQTLKADAFRQEARRSETSQEG